jgi:hypothetical protein
MLSPHLHTLLAYDVGADSLPVCCTQFDPIPRGLTALNACVAAPAHGLERARPRRLPVTDMSFERIPDPAAYERANFRVALR